MIPLQVLKELNLVLSEAEIRDFYRLVNQYPEFIELSWEPTTAEQVTFFEECDCRKGDAVIAAHAQASGVTTIVSENRQFLQTIKDLPFKIVTADEAETRLPKLLSCISALFDSPSLLS